MTIMYIKNPPLYLALSFAISMLFFTCLVQAQDIDYSQKENWVYFNEKSQINTISTPNNTTKQSLSVPLTDVFFIAPTVYAGAENAHNMSLYDTEARANFLGATNMEKGIYDNNARFFAPYYQQVGLSVYKLPLDEQKNYLEKAYADIRKAFLFYMEQENKGQPFILAGFSQGADMCIRLLKEFFDKEEYQKRLIACYALGWRLTEKDVAQYPHLVPAQKAHDIGVIISFNSEAKHIAHSLMIPKGTKTYAINPLTWTTSTNKADKSFNKGACFTDYSGAIVSEIPSLTGAYLDETRGALKVFNIEEKNYPALLDIFEEGIYHIYDYLFFYRNLQENVTTRRKAYFTEF